MNTTDSTTHAAISQTAFGYDAAGVQTATSAAGAFAYTYDADGRVLTEASPGGLTLTYAYDAAGNVASLADSAGGLTASTYGTGNRLQTRTFTAPGQTPLRIAYGYDASGRLASETRYNAVAAGTVLGSASYGYDADGNLTTLDQFDGSGSAVEHYVYAYAGGRLASETRNGGPATVYAYDAQGQVIGDGNSTYAYDLAGNRTGPLVSTGPLNELLTDGSWNYQYDSSGRLVAKLAVVDATDRWAYRYDADDRLTRAEHWMGGGLALAVDSKYAPSGDRIEKAVWTAATGTVVTRYASTGGQAYADLDAAGNVVARYFRGADDELVGVGRVGGLTAVLTDRLGSVRDVRTPGGSSHVDYTAFGVPLTGGQALTVGAGWGNLAYDPESGLYRGTVARAYDPVTARWSSPDPARFRTGDANLYRYVGNEATAHTDTTGHWWLDRKADQVYAAGQSAYTVTTDVVVGAVKAVVNAFRIVSIAGRNFSASVVETLTTARDTVTWLNDEFFGALMVIGDHVIKATKAAAEQFVQGLKDLGGSFLELWDKVKQFGAAADDVLQALVNDPAGFLSNLGKSVGKGLSDFVNNLDTTLQTKLLEWLTQGLEIGRAHV